MPRDRKFPIVKISLLLATVPFLIQAFEYGTPPRYTGAPGDKSTCVASGCHTGTVNSGSGNVKIILPAGNVNTWTPGQSMMLLVQITDAGENQFGFQLTARLASNAANGQAGDFTTLDSTTQVICDDASAKPNGSACPAASPVEFVNQTLAGYAGTTKGSATFKVMWTPPASLSAGNVTFYAAADAGPGGSVNPLANPTDVYTTSLSLAPVAAGAPAITPGGIVPIYSSTNTIQPGSWISIFGVNLAPSAAFWNNDFPTLLNGVSVFVNGTRAFLWYVSPTQLNVQAPDDSPTAGPINVVVRNDNGTASSTVTLAQAAPSFSLLDARYPAAVILTPDGSGAYGGGTYDLLGPVGHFAFKTRPVRKGENLVLFGVGFGPTTPLVPAGQLFTGAAMTKANVQIMIGGALATVPFAGLTSAGLYQINLTVPAAAASGDQLLVANLQGITAQPNIYIPVQ